MEYKRITVEELQANIEQYVDLYDKGDDTHYLIENDGKYCVMTPYDGPWEQTIKKTDDGESIVELPNRLMSKLGWDANTRINADDSTGNIILTKIEDETKD